MVHANFDALHDRESVMNESNQQLLTDLAEKLVLTNVCVDEDIEEFMLSAMVVGLNRAHIASLAFV